jgi:hypothetical protein
VRWAGYIVCAKKMSNTYKIFVGKPETKDILGDIGTDGRIILKWIFKE